VYVGLFCRSLSSVCRSLLSVCRSLLNEIDKLSEN